MIDNEVERDVCGRCVAMQLVWGPNASVGHPHGTNCLVLFCACISKVCI